MNTLKIWICINMIFGYQMTAFAQNKKPMNTIDIKGLRTTIYKVSDLQKATAWYTKCFGVAPYFNEPYYVGFNIGGYELGLLPEENDSLKKTTNVLSYWAVDDIIDAFDKMVSHGAKELEVPNDVGDGVMVSLVKDPWNNVIGLIYNPYFKEKMSEDIVIEMAPFKLKKSTTLEQLKAISKRLELEFLVKQRGFIKRELLHKSQDEWVDLIYWESLDLAQRAVAKAHNNETAHTYFELMILPKEHSSSSKISHYKILEY